MNPGDLDTPIKFERVSEISGATGDIDETWVEFADAWASLRYLKGRELLEAKQLVSEVEVLFECWYCAELMNQLDVDPKDRINALGKYFDILYLFPVPGGRPEKLQIYAKVRQA